MNISKMEDLTEEQFERLLQDLGTSSDLDLFNSLYDPNLLPLSDSDISGLLSLPPLPPIEEEPSSISVAAPNGHLLEDDVSENSNASSESEANDALEEATAAKRLVEAQWVKLDEMRKELESLRKIFEEIQNYQHKSLNPWMAQVEGYLRSIGGPSDESPTSATQLNFDSDLGRP